MTAAHTENERIEAALRHVPANDRNLWLKILMALKSEYDEAGRDIAETWSKTDPSFNAQDFRDVWKGTKPGGGVNIGTLIHYAKQHGWRDDQPHVKPTPEQIAQRKAGAAKRDELERIEKARRHQEAAKTAQNVHHAAPLALPNNLYLVRKDVLPVSMLKELPASKLAKILNYAPQSDGQPLTGNILIAPIMVSGKLASLEFIDESGRKSALKGGAKAGGYAPLQAMPEGNGEGLTLLIGEGVASCLTAKQATGYPAFAALSSGNLLSVAKQLRTKYPTAAFVILGELLKSSGELDPHSTHAAEAIGARLAVPDFGKERHQEQTDINDLSAKFGADAVQKLIDEATRADDTQAPQNTIEAPIAAEIFDTNKAETTAETRPGLDIQALAKLSLVEYDRIRESTAIEQGVRVSTLDTLVSDARRAKASDSKPMMFKIVEPWQDPVNPVELLNTINATVKRFIICDDATAHAATLWIVFSWLIDHAEVAPIAIITAPEKRCGKSQFLDLISRLSRKPLVASNISPPAVFRVIEAHRPTLFIDECDTFLRDNEELRGVINSGHTRQSAYVIRTTGDDHEPKQFSTWSAKVLCGIGAMPETLMDRAIVLELRRKLATESVERLRHAERGLFDRLARKLARFADDFAGQITALRPSLPDELNDRAQDNWEVLLQIADFAGGHWPKTARTAALKISAEKEQMQSVSVELLGDIQDVFTAKRTPRISTADLIEALINDGELSWATYNRGKPLSFKQLAKRLKEFGIQSKDIKMFGHVKKSFELTQFADAFSRYLSPSTENLPLPATETHKSPPLQGLGENLAATCAATIRYPLPNTVAANGNGSATENVPATRKPFNDGLSGEKVAGSGKIGGVTAGHIEVTL